MIPVPDKKLTNRRITNFIINLNKLYTLSEISKKTGIKETNLKRTIENKYFFTKKDISKLSNAFFVYPDMFYFGSITEYITEIFTFNIPSPKSLLINEIGIIKLSEYFKINMDKQINDCKKNNQNNSSSILLYPSIEEVSNTAASLNIIKGINTDTLIRNISDSDLIIEAQIIYDKYIHKDNNDSSKRNIKKLEKNINLISSDNVEISIMNIFNTQKTCINLLKQVSNKSNIKYKAIFNLLGISQINFSQNIPYASINTDIQKEILLSLNPLNNKSPYTKNFALESINYFRK